jgi:hypothetical protein
MSLMDLHGRLTFEPVPPGTRMRWSWQLQPRGVLRLMGPLVASMGRRGNEAAPAPEGSSGSKARLETFSSMPIQRHPEPQFLVVALAAERE